jgi:hypothetical protein
MAEGPWRCSECGTVNEPVANSCRTCGRWPSLFDLDASVVDEVELEDAREPAPGAYFPEQAPVEPAPFEPEPIEAEPIDTRPYELEPDAGEPEGQGASRRRRLMSFIVPLAFVVYLVISIVFGER